MVQTRSSNESKGGSGSPSSNPPQRHIQKDTKRGVGYSEIEVGNFLKLLEEHQPIGPSAWTVVMDIHNIRNQTSRTTESLKRKFKQLHQSRPKTGDPFIPENVKKAKRIKKAMVQRAQIGEMSSSTKPSQTLQDNSTEKSNDAPEHDLTESESLVAVPLSQKRGSLSQKDESKAQDILELYKLQLIEKEKDRELQERQRREERKEMLERAERESIERREELKLERES